MKKQLDNSTLLMLVCTTSDHLNKKIGDGMHPISMESFFSFKDHKQFCFKYIESVLFLHLRPTELNINTQLPKYKLKILKCSNLYYPYHLNLITLIKLF